MKEVHYTTDIKMIIGQIFIAIVSFLFITATVCLVIDIITEPSSMTTKEYNEMIALKKIDKEPSIMFDDLEL